MQDYDDDGDLYGGQRSPKVKCGKLCLIVTKLVRRMPGASLKEAKGHQRSNVANHVLQ